MNMPSSVSRAEVNIIEGPFRDYAFDHHLWIAQSHRMPLQASQIFLEDAILW